MKIRDTHDPEMPGSGSGNRPRRDPQSTVFAIIGGVLVALAALLLVFGGSEAVDLDAIDIPDITLHEPLDGQVVDGQLKLVFDPGARIQPGPFGWEHGPIHLHVVLNRREFMPTRRDVERVGTDRYRWTLPPFSEGEYDVQLVWATDRHGALPDGASERVTVRMSGNGEARLEEMEPHGADHEPR